MQDETALQNLINTYSQSVSIGEWDPVVETFLPNGVWDIPHLDMRMEGQEAIRDALIGFVAGMDYVLQMNGPARIQVTGDRATARSAIRECGKTKGKDEGFEFLGLYYDEMVRTDQGWKFARRVFKGVGTHFFPLVKGEAH